MSEHPNRPPTAQCAGCANAEALRCAVFCDPNYQHERPGGCYGRTRKDAKQKEAAHA